MGSASSTDFTAAVSTINAGENAARGMLGRLEALRVGDAAYTDYLVRRAAREPGLPPIKFVRVDEQSKRYEKTIMAEMQPLVGKPLNVNAVGERITELYGLGNFETLDYALVDQGQGADEESGIEIRARRKSWGPTYVRFGLDLEDNFQGNSRYNAAARFILTRTRQARRRAGDGCADRQRSESGERVLSALNATRTWFIAPSLRIEARGSAALRQ